MRIIAGAFAALLCVPAMSAAHAAEDIYYVDQHTRVLGGYPGGTLTQQMLEDAVNELKELAGTGGLVADRGWSPQINTGASDSASRVSSRNTCCMAGLSPSISVTMMTTSMIGDATRRPVRIAGKAAGICTSNTKFVPGVFWYQSPCCRYGGFEALTVGQAGPVMVAASGVT